MTPSRESKSTGVLAEEWGRLQLNPFSEISYIFRENTHDSGNNSFERALQKVSNACLAKTDLKSRK